MTRYPMLELALDVSLRSLAAAAAVGLVLVGLRVRSGAARHAAWSAVLVAMLTMPLLIPVVPRVDMPVPSSIASSFDVIAGDASAYQRPDLPPAQQAGGRPSSAVVTSPGVEAKMSPVRAVIDPRNAAMMLYVAGALFFFIQTAAGWILARRLTGGAIRVSCGNRAPVFETQAIVTPMTAGILFPRVLLPTDWRGWQEDTLRAVLAHENAHITRRDALVAFLARINRAIFWFHPLAWWLERTLAVAAEHACDDTAARQLGHSRRYAEVLLDMAEAVQRGGHRVAWQTLGVDGSGVLGTRIDRLLKGDAMARMSAGRRVAVAVGCSAMLVLAVACRQQTAAAPLRADPEIQKQIDDRRARSERHRAAIAMTAEQAAALERSLDANPENLEARESLIIFYDQSGKATWEQKLAGIRKHALWRIAHLPETDLWIPNISKRYDPTGYAQAKQLWLERTSRPDVTPNTLARAAAFLTPYDKPLAEELLIRAQRMEPAGPWTDRLMDLYAQAITGSVDPRAPEKDAAQAQSAFAAEAQRKIETASDPNVLTNAGFALKRWAPARSDAAAFARRLLERAVAHDPQNVRARTGLANDEYFERLTAIQERLRGAGASTAFDDFSSTTAAAVSALPVEDQLFFLPAAAESAYMRAENIDYRASQKPEAEAKAQVAAQGYARARQYANDALALARRNEPAARDNDVVYRAETVLGVLALKDGDRRTAVAHMHNAGAAALPEPARYASHFGLRSRLAEYMLKAGERASVAEYLEKSAARTPSERDQLVKDAVRVREGMMPTSYQYAQAARAPR